MAINQNQALYSILGTAYGGNGQSTFALPDLRGRAAASGGGQTPLGGTQGVETVALTTLQIPSHLHVLQASSAAGTKSSPAAAVWATSPANTLQYLKSGQTDGTIMAASASGPGGQGQGHPNMPPMTVMNFIIALQGIYPSRT